jgi:hypothetical protein
MALTYDFDICAANPDQGSGDTKTDALLARLAARTGTMSGSVAQFRSARTAQALRDAPEGLRAYFLASGFGLDVSGSDTPPGLYPAADEEARLAVICRLTENAAAHQLPPPDDHAADSPVFHLGAFLAELDHARPVDAVPQGLPPVFQTAQLQPLDAAPPPPAKFWQQRSFRLALVALVLLGLVQLASGPALTVLASF